ncbi:unnamed protein product, partial [Meganyctiphanes norvegica]
VDVGVECINGEMLIRVDRRGVEDVQLLEWGELKMCQPRLSDVAYTLALPLEPLTCGITRVKNKLTGASLYYHRVDVKTAKGRETVMVKCRLAHDNTTVDSNIVKRDVLPPSFVEPDYIEITSEVTGTAPIPILGVGVRQNGKIVGGQINVVPGTPLNMEVFLDDVSADIYGILMSYMEVTDTADKKEVIVFNGCSTDVYLFENFVTSTGDSVSAKFRAFKFPETNYVLFRGTVDVCLDKCQGILCSNGQQGFGRRRRDINSSPADPNKIYEVSMMTFLKVEESPNGIKVDVAEGLSEVERDIVRAAGEDPSHLLPWSQAADDGTYLMPADNENEPTFIYFNTAVTAFSQSLFLVA